MKCQDVTKIWKKVLSLLWLLLKWIITRSQFFNMQHFSQEYDAISREKIKLLNNRNIYNCYMRKNLLQNIFWFGKDPSFFSVFYV